MKELIGNYGKVVFCDCLTAMRGLPDKSWDMCVSDPPYNIDAKETVGMNSDLEKGLQRVVETYNDNRGELEYYRWCREWFTELARITNYGVFTSGFTNLGYWLWVHKLGYIIWIHRNTPSRAFTGFYNYQEPIICYGKFNRKYQTDIVEIPVNSGFMLTNQSKEEMKIIHPHPKPVKLFRYLIINARPKSVIDIFGGSGITAQVCEECGIPYLVYEINEAYENDIRIRINEGRKKYSPKRLKVYNKMSITDYVKEEDENNPPAIPDMPEEKR